MRHETYRGEAGELAGADTDDGVFDAASLSAISPRACAD